MTDDQQPPKGRTPFTWTDVAALAVVSVFVIALIWVCTAPARSATAEDFDRVQPGWSRWHTQQILDDQGTRVGMWATSRHRFLQKTYPADNGGSYQVTYRGPLCAPQIHPNCGPFAGPYHVWEKQVVAP